MADVTDLAAQRWGDKANSGPAHDRVVEANRRLLLERSELGLKKYGEPLHDFKGDRRAILQHQLEEILDLANYIQTEIMKFEGE